jgi:hypothetical protein
MEFKQSMPHPTPTSSVGFPKKACLPPALLQLLRPEKFPTREISPFQRCYAILFFIRE